MWKQPAEGFDWLALCLRFANTADWHASPRPKESLADYQDLVVWGVRGSLLSRHEAARLMGRASAQPRRAPEAGPLPDPAGHPRRRGNHVNGKLDSRVSY